MEKINTVKRDNLRIISLSSDYTMRYIRPKHEKKYYLYFLCLSFLCMLIFWTVSYLDYINMINNGFVSKSAVTFEVEEIEKVEETLTKVKDPFVLFQYDPSMPEIKHVLINGGVKLPPITTTSKKDITKYNSNIAITGHNFNDEVPIGYKEIGHFNTPNSYKLNTEMWLVSNEFDITADKGIYFTIMTPGNNEYKTLKELLPQDTIKFLNTEIYGTYIMGSNRFINSGLFVSVAFLTFIFTIIGTLWINKEKHFINILYLSGYPPHVIFKNIINYKIIPYTICSAVLIVICVVVQKFIFPLWTNTWILNSLYLLIGFNVYLLVFSFIKVFSYTVKKGGKRF